MQSGLSIRMELVSDYILMRRPALPRKWDPVARPHVAIIVDDPLTGQNLRYYLSYIGPVGLDGKESLEMVNLDQLATDLPEGALLEVRFSATNANLYRLEACGALSCWRWVGKYRGIQDYEFPSPINWEEMVMENQVVNPPELS
ncbi:MAG: hypothetical protein ACW98Y_03915 [Candidatus Thorarchaeota archaeon]